MEIGVFMGEMISLRKWFIMLQRQLGDGKLPKTPIVLVAGYENTLITGKDMTPSNVAYASKKSQSTPTPPCVHLPVRPHPLDTPQDILAHRPVVPDGHCKMHLGMFVSGGMTPAG